LTRGTRPPVELFFWGLRKGGRMGKSNDGSSKSWLSEDAQRKGPRLANDKVSNRNECVRTTAVGKLKEKMTVS